MNAFLGVAQSATGRVWLRKDWDEASVEHIVQLAGIHPVLAQVLAVRGVSAQQVDRFLNPSIKSDMPDPSVLNGITQAVERTYEAFEKNEKIGIFGDYDVDGVTSASLLTRYFQQLDIPHHVHIPDRFTEGYGPNSAAMSLLRDQGATLCFTVDCGSTAFDEVDHAQSIGMDVVVLDHHKMKAELPAAIAIVNPHNPDDISGLTNLSAVGVCFMFLVALNRTLREAGFFKDKPEPNLLAWLDIVGLGLVCDVMPMKGLTRTLIVQGLKVLGNYGSEDKGARPYPGLRELGVVAGLEGRAAAHHFGFMLGPRINAAGRIGHAREAFKLLTAQDQGDARKSARRLQELNIERQAIEEDVLEAAIQQAEKNGGQERRAIIVGGDGWHAGVVGIVASRLKDRFHKPAFVFSFEGDVGKGSARSVEGIDLGKMTHEAVQAGVLHGGGGHAMAAGMTINSQKFESYAQFVNDWVLRHAEGPTGPPVLELDGVVSVKGITRQFAETLQCAGPFGSGNPEPRFALEAVSRVYADIKGEKHVAITFMNQLGQRGRGIAFRAVDTPLGDVLLASDNRKIHLAGKIKEDSWRGGDAAQVIIDDAAFAE